MKILVTGGHGQLGKQLERTLQGSHAVISLGKSELNVTDKNKAEKIINQVRPQLIIHAAAYTAVDKCEINLKKAFEVNTVGTGYIAQAASKVGARMFYISTDYVFDGLKRSPYHEEDEPNPQTIYGLTKWLGEKMVRKYSEGTIIRTSWLFGHEGKNFVKTMLRLAKENIEIKVIDDQIGSPTYVNDLTDTIIQLLDKDSGIYHVSNSGSCTWHEFAQAIFTFGGYNPNLVVPVKSEEFGSLAPRPYYSVLGNDALIKENVNMPRPWEEALKVFIRKEIYQ